MAIARCRALRLCKVDGRRDVYDASFSTALSLASLVLFFCSGPLAHFVLPLFLRFFVAYLQSDSNEKKGCAPKLWPVLPAYARRGGGEPGRRGLGARAKEEV